LLAADEILDRVRQPTHLGADAADFSNNGSNFAAQAGCCIVGVRAVCPIQLSRRRFEIVFGGRTGRF
jgi:hypothetical protein